MNEDYLDAALRNPDSAMHLLLQGISRAEQRHRAKLRTIDAHGNPIPEPTQQEDPPK